MKVSLNGEFGVVINSYNQNFEVIRWDTNTQNDSEDWTGQFGSFLQIGGKILDDDYKFKFINDDGSLKLEK